MGKKPAFALVATATAILVVLATVAYLQLSSTHLLSPPTDYIKLYSDVRTLIKQKYVEPVSDKKLTEGAVRGMLAALDPHSEYLPPAPYREMSVELRGTFGGIGIEIGIQERKLTVIAPIEDTPAYRAGIRAGDHIWKIDSRPTSNLTITEAVNLMRGPKGTRVTLTLLRAGNRAPIVVHLVRDIIRTHSIRNSTLAPGYGYIRIGHFQETTGDEFAKALAKLHAENRGALKGLIIDLRNNPGGTLDSAIAVANHFIGKGFSDGLIVSTRGRLPSANHDFSATIGDKEARYPMVVLVNGGSASASEILAGALQDHGRAVIMGTQTFGKGSVQTIIPLRNGGGLKLTTACYYTPSGRSIQAKGITPDIVVDQYDLATLTPIESSAVREQNLQNHLPAQTVRSRTVPPVKPLPPSPHVPQGNLTHDYQLNRALGLLLGLTPFLAPGSSR